jgi:hypothetical protein
VSIQRAYDEIKPANSLDVSIIMKSWTTQAGHSFVTMAKSKKRKRKTLIG